MRTMRRGEVRWSCLKITQLCHLCDFYLQSSRTFSYICMETFSLLIPNKIKSTSSSWYLILPSLKEALRKWVFNFTQRPGPAFNAGELLRLCSSPADAETRIGKVYMTVKHLFQKLLVLRWQMGNKSQYLVLQHVTFDHFLSSGKPK